MAKTYDFKMSITQLSFFLDKIKDLLGIDKDNQINLKIDRQNVLIYSLVGERRIVTAFKSFIFNVEEVMSLNKEEIGDDILKFIIVDGKKFEATLKNFLDFEDDLTGQLSADDDSFVDNLRIKNSKLKLNINGGDQRALTVDIDVDRIKEVAKIGEENFKFQLDKTNFDRIKKMSRIEVQEENPVLNLIVANKALSISEYTWDLNICEVDYDDTTISFPKKFFNSISFGNDEVVTIYIFDSFLFIDNNITSLLISVEIDA